MRTTTLAEIWWRWSARLSNLRRRTSTSRQKTQTFCKSSQTCKLENVTLTIRAQVKVKLEEVNLELNRMKEDRDFHNEQHINLRNEILGIVKQEYELESIKREKAFIEDELRSYKEKALIYEKQIDELTILAKRPVSQSANGGNAQELYYAKKIMELEA